MLIDIPSGFMQAYPHPVWQHFSAPEQSLSARQARTQMPAWPGLSLGQKPGFSSTATIFENISIMIRIKRRA